MSLTARWTRLLMVVSAVGLAGAAYLIRAVMDGPIEQYSGAAFSAAIVYTIVIFVRPSILPLTAGGVVVAYCWFIEFSQLTPIPGAVSERSWFARQLLGAQFDLTDVIWYPVGAVLLVVAHWLVRARARSQKDPAPALAS
ncbi:ribosomal maturation YjgA family protein [Actinomadura geliboluensis]|uniref:ribosomal maturation YjgA family protein n=1 Tax=Actinomadura geliboluensis TaxID=882440 RepID=UPI00371DC7FC